jgi:hypothetical protein
MDSIKKRPQAEVYGFVLWVVTFFMMGFYLLFAWLPTETLHQYGITYYPDRYWALGIPAYIPFTYVIGITMNFLWIYYKAQPLDEFGILEDEYTNYAIQTTRWRCRDQSILNWCKNTLKEILTDQIVVKTDNCQCQIVKVDVKGEAYLSNHNQ